MTRTRILVVEDDEDVRASLADTLRDAGYEAETSPNGWAALERLRADAAFSLIIRISTCRSSTDGVSARSS